MVTNRSKIDRRRFVGALLAGTTVVAGCLDGEPEGDEQPADPEDDDGDVPDGDELGEPTAFPDDRQCAVCSMIAAEYPDWNGQLVHGDGHREYFCSTGCLVAYVFAPAKFTAGDPEEPIEGIWATEFSTGDLVDVTEGHLVYEQDRERQAFPMPMGSPLAFAEHEDALAYVDEHDDLEADEHLLTLADVDREVAEFYRAPRLEEEADGG